jgi:hypothetical protein
VAHEGEERGDTEGFVAIAENLKVDRVMVKKDAQPGDEGVNGDHKKNANDTGKNKDLLVLFS